ncbi:tuftelin isoform X2 [Bombina bombina]|uniref:tuftelin isoform X2 n=1 Tax=Bombina bombina TaxID=8345 RepID=UPI00235B00C0|nr:tuftelin isoform X2 [Bombina bombina]
MGTDQTAERGTAVRMNNLCTIQQLNAEPEPDHIKTLRLTLREDHSPERGDSTKVKPVGRAFALISSRPFRGTQPLNSELIKSKDGDEEIIKVYLKAKAENKANHEWSVNQLKNEVRQIQEARTSIKILREDFASVSSKYRENDLQSNKVELLNGDRHYGDSWREAPSTEEIEDFPLDNGKNLRETAQKLFYKLQEAERRQQDERRLYEDKLSRCQQEAEQSNRARKEAEETATERQREVEELRRLMGNMEKEHKDLLQKMKENEQELEHEKGKNQQDGPLKERCEELEKTVSGLREKIHHLDDMLKSQQRKVRQMIEQLQNSRTAMQEKDSLIQDLQEKVSWLQAENLELQDKLEHFRSSQPGQMPFTSRNYSRPNMQNVKRVYIPAGSGRPLPLIKLVET